jgi:glycosyltransferase involved in cell wall biosynthesis
MPLKILFLVPYPLNQAPSQRFRFEQYFELLKQHGHSFRIQSFLNSRNGSAFYQHGNWPTKILIIIKGLLKRAAILFHISSYDHIFIHREATPIGPPFFEWMIARVFRAKIIYDFDDAIWMTDRERESGILSFLKWRSKISAICRWSYKVSCGNNYLAAFSRQFNPSTIFLPSTIDTVFLHNPTLYLRHKDNSKIRIGWTGSHSTLKYLKEIEPVMQRLELEYSNLEFIVIADRAPDLDLKTLRFTPWSPKTEILDLIQLDIGIMPLPDDPWALGKCGFKLLQYMALEIPSVASSVGVNNQIIQHDQNGFLCTSHQEWYTGLQKLIEDSGLRSRFGKNGRSFVEKYYSVEANASVFLNLFKES